MLNNDQLQRRHAKWEEIGHDAIRHALQTTGGVRYVGGTPQTRQQAREWVAMKDLAAKEAFILKPAFHGVGIDLNVALKKARRIAQWIARACRR